MVLASSSPGIDSGINLGTGNIAQGLQKGGLGGAAGGFFSNLFQGIDSPEGSLGALGGIASLFGGSPSFKQVSTQNKQQRQLTRNVLGEANQAFNRAKRPYSGATMPLSSSPLQKGIVNQAQGVANRPRGGPNQFVQQAAQAGGMQPQTPGAFGSNAKPQKPEDSPAQIVQKGLTQVITKLLESVS